MDKLVSVVIPVYNVEEYLKECVDSVLCQTYRNLQILLVDDGATDNSGAICDDYAKKDDRVQVIHKPNGGLSDARNAGFAQAKGEYVYFLDSDDWILPFTIEALVQTAEKEQSDMVFFDADVFGLVTLPRDYYHRKGMYSSRQTGKEAFEKLMINGEYRSVVYLLFFRKTFLQEANLSFLKGALHEDELYTFQAFMLCEKVTHLPYKLYRRRVREGSIITQGVTSRHFAGLVMILQQMCIFADANHLTAVGARENIGRIAGAAADRYRRLSFAEKKKCRAERKLFLKLCKENKFFGQWVSLIRVCFGVDFLFKVMGRLRVKKLLRWILSVRKRKKTVNFPYEKQEKPTVWVIGTPAHGNLGDHAIAIAEMKLLREQLPDYRICDVLMPQYHANKERLREVVGPEDVLVICGGGWLGTLWLHNEIVAREVIQAYTQNKIIIFPQTVFYEETEEGKRELEIAKSIYPKHQKLYFCLRDKQSYDFVLEQGLISDPDRCFYLPDTALTLSFPEKPQKKDTVLFCFRQDREQSMTEAQRWDIRQKVLEMGKKPQDTTTVYLQDISVEARESAVEGKLREYAEASLVITDRLHSMIFAAITGTPCIAFDNKSKKVAGVFAWMQELKYIKVVQTGEEAKKLLSELLAEKECYHTPNSFVQPFAQMLAKVMGDE